MLIEFAVSNYRSIRDEQRLSLAAGTEKKTEDANGVFEPQEKDAGKKPLQLLRSVGIHGPNGAGKTNLLRALAAMQEIVIAPPAPDTSSGAPVRLPVEPFHFDAPARSQPTSFEAVVMAEGVRYRYGISATGGRILGEWLFTFSGGHPKRWFERHFDPDGDREKLTLTNKLTGDRRAWRRAARPDTPLLSTAAALGDGQLQPLFRWFRDKLHVIGADGQPSPLSMAWARDEKKERILEFLRATDFPVSDLKIAEEEAGPGPDSPGTGPAARVRQNFYGIRGMPGGRLLLVHKASGGQRFESDLRDESDGMKKMFDLAAPWLDALEQGKILAVDGPDGDLHPLLMECLVGLFQSARTNPAGAQLLFTAHGTWTLDPCPRRSRIWLCERDKDQSTVIYNLADFRPPKGGEDLARAYLAGRYGALPFVDEPSIRRLLGVCRT